MRIMKKWDTELNVGIGLIDNQHKIIFDLVNDLGKASEGMADKKVIETLFDVIENYVFRHFEAEEDRRCPRLRAGRALIGALRAQEAALSLSGGNAAGMRT